jgi:FolB domain-containing protein
MRIKIYIDRLKVRGSVGVHAWERACRRSFFVNAELTVDYNPVSDEISSTIDYGELSSNIVDFVSKANCSLVEKLACDILQLIIQDKKVVCCKLEVIKRFTMLNLSSMSVKVEYDKINNAP